MDLLLLLLERRRRRGTLLLRLQQRLLLLLVLLLLLHLVFCLGRLSIGHPAAAPPPPTRFRGRGDSSPTVFSHPLHFIFVFSLLPFFPPPHFFSTHVRSRGDAFTSGEQKSDKFACLFSLRLPPTLAFFARSKRDLMGKGGLGWWIHLFLLFSWCRGLFFTPLTHHPLSSTFFTHSLRKGGKKGGGDDKLRPSLSRTPPSLKTFSFPFSKMTF